jgi:hypothetical protein
LEGGVPLLLLVELSTSTGISDHQQTPPSYNGQHNSGTVMLTSPVVHVDWGVLAFHQEKLGTKTVSGGVLIQS